MSSDMKGLFCVRCGNPLTRKQRKFCSDICRLVEQQQMTNERKRISTSQRLSNIMDFQDRRDSQRFTMNLRNEIEAEKHFRKRKEYFFRKRTEETMKASSCVLANLDNTARNVVLFQVELAHLAQPTQMGEGYRCASIGGVQV